MHCRYHAVQLHREREGFGEVADRVHLVGMGTPAHARAFKDETGVDFPILLSRDKEAYRAFDLQRGSLAQVFAPEAMRLGRERARGGEAGRARGGNLVLRRPAQDWHQLGGAFVVAAGGEVVWSHRAEHSGDNPPHEPLIAALREAAGGARR